MVNLSFYMLRLLQGRQVKLMLRQFSVLSKGWVVSRLQTSVELTCD